MWTRHEKAVEPAVDGPAPTVPETPRDGALPDLLPLVVGFPAPALLVDRAGTVLAANEAGRAFIARVVN